MVENDKYAMTEEANVLAIIAMNEWILQDISF